MYISFGQNHTDSLITLLTANTLILLDFSINPNYKMYLILILLDFSINPNYKMYLILTHTINIKERWFCVLWRLVMEE